MGSENLYAFPDRTAAELKNHFERIENVLRTSSSTDEVRQKVAAFTEAMCNRRLKALSRVLWEKLLIRRDQPLGTGPETRTPRFDDAVDQFIIAAKSALVEVERLEQDLIQNEGLPPAEYRKRILDFLLKRQRDEYPGSAQIALALAIPYGEVMDALELLEEEGAIKAIKSEALNGPPSWRVELTPRGRNLAKGWSQPQEPSQPAIVFNQQFHNSTVANAGVNNGTVNQTVNSFPSLPLDVRNALQQSDIGMQLLDALDEQTHHLPPQRSALRVILGSIKTLIESGNLTTEVALHGHEWLAAAQHWLSVIHP